MNTRLIKGGITAPQGFSANGLVCGIKKSGKKDLSLIYSAKSCVAAGVFTTNKVKASCVILNKKRIAKGVAQAIVVNSGNANCLTGKRGFEDSLAMAAAAADILGVSEEHVCVVSTGIIGKPLPIEKITAAMPQLAAGLGKRGGRAAAEGIMTTDHVSKEAAIECVIGGAKVCIGAIAKGGGMIHPQMATMLCFVSTDVSITQSALKHSLGAAVEKTFNMITVDGDMSTNDMVLILANGLATNKRITKSSKELEVFTSALESLFLKIVEMMMRDAEGATKFVEVRVSGARSRKDARTIARSIASSNLVKCAIFGSDPNWGRIAVAAGYAGGALDPEKMKIYLGRVLVLKNGGAVHMSSARTRSVFKKKKILITVDLGLGKYSANAYTCDLSTDYVLFNSAYYT